MAVHVSPGRVLWEVLGGSWVFPVRVLGTWNVITKILNVGILKSYCSFDLCKISNFEDVEIFKISRLLETAIAQFPGRP